jgi:hypothetical protein
MGERRQEGRIVKKEKRKERHIKKGRSRSRVRQ